MDRFLIIALFFFLTITKLNAGYYEADTLFSKRYGLSKNYFKSYVQDTKNLLISPFKWGKKDIIKASAFTGASALLFVFEEDIFDFIQNNRTSGLDKMSKYVFEPIGSGLYPFIGFGSLYLYGVAFSRENSVDFALLAAKTFFISGMMAQLIKSGFGRHRPYNDYPTNHSLFDPGSFKYSSFVSGHTTIAFSMATLIALEFKDKPLIPVLSYSLATFAGLSRIYDNKHWATDVLGGAVLGYTVGRFMYKRNRRVQIRPMAGPSYSGLSLIISVN